ncbi:M15 family metallopeptidase [Candidatus Gracilibacteria bacterium]|jgi:hypothetical protein|nr:M15 family metallopeptidase [Candidatus Gracilibacteria bacterium]
MAEIKGVGIVINYNGYQEENEKISNGVPNVPYNYFITWHAVEEQIIGNIGYTNITNNSSIETCEKENQEVPYGQQTFSSYVTPQQVSSIPLSTQVGPYSPEYINEQKQKELVYNQKQNLSLQKSPDNYFNYNLPKFPIFKNDDLLINYVTGVYSVDPAVCILPVVSNKILITGGYELSFDNISPIRSGDFGSFKISPVNGNRIYLKDILVNLGFFYEVYKNTNTLSELLMGLLNGISNACGNLWDFQIMIDEEKSSEITIVDTKTVSENSMSDPEIFKYFKLYNKDSSVREATLNTNVPANMKNSIMLDAFLEYDQTNPKDYEQVGFRHLYDQAVKSLLKEDKFRPIQAGENLVNSPKKAEEDSKSTEPISVQLYEIYKKLEKGRTSEIVERAKQILKTYLAQMTIGSDKAPLPHKNFVLFPLSLTLKIDGIAGITWGNKIMIDYLPKRYIDNSKFQVTNVKQDVSINDWTTTIETIWRIIQPSEIKSITSSQQISTSSNPIMDECWKKINPKTPQNGERVLTGESKKRLYFPDRSKTSKKGYKNGFLPVNELTPLSFNSKILLDPTAAYYLEKMNKAYLAQGGGRKNLPISSGYRAFQEQIECKEHWMRKEKCQNAAEPGKSNHGFAKSVDFSTGGTFSDGSELHTWLLTNSKTYYWKPLAQHGDEYWHFDYTGVTSL